MSALTQAQNQLARVADNVVSGRGTTRIVSHLRDGMVAAAMIASAAGFAGKAQAFEEGVRAGNMPVMSVSAEGVHDGVRTVDRDVGLFGRAVRGFERIKDAKNPDQVIGGILAITGAASTKERNMENAQRRAEREAEAEQRRADREAARQAAQQPAAQYAPAAISPGNAPGATGAYKSAEEAQAHLMSMGM